MADKFYPNMIKDIHVNVITDLASVPEEMFYDGSIDDKVLVYIQIRKMSGERRTNLFVVSEEAFADPEYKNELLLKFIKSELEKE